MPSKGIDISHLPAPNDELDISHLPAPESIDTLPPPDEVKMHGENPPEGFEGPALPIDKIPSNLTKENLAKMPKWQQWLAANVISGLDSASYGQLKLGGEGEEGEKFRKLFTENNKIPALVGQLEGFVDSPITKGINLPAKAAVKIGSSIPKIAKFAEESPKLMAALKYLTRGAEGAAMIGAQKGDQSIGQEAGGAAFNALAAKFSWLATGVGAGLMGSQLSDSEDVKKYGPIAGAGLGAITQLLTKSPSLGGGLSQAIDKLKLDKSERLKAPIEDFESTIQSMGEKTPQELRHEPSLYKPSGGAPMSDELKKTYDALEQIKLKANSDLSEAEQGILAKKLREIPELKYKTLGEVQENPVELDKVLKIIDEMNKSRGVKEDAMTTLNDQIQTLKDKRGDNYNAANETISNFLIGRQMQPAFTHSQRLSKALTKTGGEEVLPDQFKDVYGKLLQMNEGVRSGTLNKWMQPAENGELDPIIRYFNKTKELLPADVQKLTESGTKLYPGRQNLIEEIQKMNEGNKNIPLTEDTEKLSLLKNLKGELKDKSFDNQKGKFVNMPQDVMSAKIDLRNLGEKSNWAPLAEMTTNPKQFETILGNYRSNPKKMETTIRALQEDGLNNDQIIKLLSTRTSYLDEYLKGRALNSKAVDKSQMAESYNQNLDMKNQQRQDKINEQQNIEKSKQQFGEFKDSLKDRVQSESEPYMTQLQNMAEGKKQMAIDEPESIYSKAITKIPIVGDIAKWLKIPLDYTEKGRIKNTAQNEPYYRQQYGKGKMIENELMDKYGSLDELKNIPNMAPDINMSSDMSGLYNKLLQSNYFNSNTDADNQLEMSDEEKIRRQIKR